MIDKIKIFLSDSLIYGAGELLTRSVQILVLPLVFVYLTPEQFGILDYFLSAKLLLTSLLGWGIITAVLRFGSSFSGHKIEEVMCNGLISVLLMFLIFLLITLPFSEQITTYLLGHSHRTAYNLTALTSGMYALRSVTQGILRLKRKPKSFLISNFIDIGFYILFSFLLLQFSGLNYLSFLVANLLSIIVSFLVSFFVTREFFVFKYNPNMILKLTKFGSAILFTSLTFIILQTSGRFFLKFHNSFEEIAVLGMATRFSLVVGSLLIAPFTLAWLPFVNTIFKNERFDDITNAIFSGFTYVGLFLSIALVFLSSDVFVLINQTAYLSSYHYIPFYCLSYLFLGYYYFFSAGIYLSDGQRSYYIIAAIVLGFNLGISFVFVEHLSVLFVSVISTVSHFILFILARYFGKAEMRISIFAPRNLVIWGVAFVYVVILLGIEMVGFTPLKSLVIKSIILLTIPISTWYSGMIRKNEKEILLSKIKALMR